MSPHLDCRFNVLWTPDKKKKVKQWNDGFVTFNATSYKLQLFDQNKRLIGNSFQPNKQLHKGSTIELERYIVELVEFNVRPAPPLDSVGRTDAKCERSKLTPRTPLGNVDGGRCNASGPNQNLIALKKLPASLDGLPASVARTNTPSRLQSLRGTYRGAKAMDLPAIYPTLPSETQTSSSASACGLDAQAVRFPKTNVLSNSDDAMHGSSNKRAQFWGQRSTDDRMPHKRSDIQDAISNGCTEGTVPPLSLLRAVNLTKSHNGLKRKRVNGQTAGSFEEPNAPRSDAVLHSGDVSWAGEREEPTYQRTGPTGVEARVEARRRGSDPIFSAHEHQAPPKILRDQSSNIPRCGPGGAGLDGLEAKDYENSQYRLQHWLKEDVSRMRKGNLGSMKSFAYTSSEPKKGAKKQTQDEDPADCVTETGVDSAPLHGTLIGIDPNMTQNMRHTSNETYCDPVSQQSIMNVKEEPLSPRERDPHQLGGFRTVSEIYIDLQSL